MTPHTPQPPPCPGESLWARRATLMVALWALLLGAALPAVASEYVPRKSRAKIDKIDLEDAPLIRIYTTFLNAKGLPVSPDKIRAAYVACNEKQIGSADEIRTFGDIGDAMDIAVVIPVSRRFPEEVQEQIKEGVSAIIGQTRDIDRVAAFVDNGVGIQQSGLGPAAEAASYVSAAETEGGGAFLYSGLEKAIDTLIEEGDSERRRALILVTDGFDTEVVAPDYVRTRLMELYQRARDENVLIFVVMYKPIIAELIPYFEGMSRKTRATYRETTTPAGILTNVKYAYGEIYGQLVVEFEHEDAEEGDSCEFSVAFEREFGGAISTRPFTSVKIEALKFNWVRFAIWAGVILLTLILLFVIFIVVRKIVRKRRAAREEEEGAALQEQIDGGLVCGTCKRTLMPDWDECMFCARDAQAAGAAGGAAAGGGKKDKAAAKKDKAAAKKDKAAAKKDKAAAKKGKAAAKKDKAAAKKDKAQADDAGAQCNSCGRQMMPGWTECLFCKAGIGGAAPGGGGGGGGGGAAPGGGAAAPGGGGGGGGGGGAMAAGGVAAMGGAAMMAGSQGASGAQPPRVCPTCKRELKDHWDECLYCAAGV